MDFSLTISVWLLPCSDALGVLLQQIMGLVQRKSISKCRGLPPTQLSLFVMPGGNITCHQESVGSAACLFLHTALPGAPSPSVPKENHEDIQRFLLLLAMMACRCLLLGKRLGSGLLWRNLDPPHHHQCQVLQDQQNNHSDLSVAFAVTLDALHQSWQWKRKNKCTVGSTSTATTDADSSH